MVLRKKKESRKKKPVEKHPEIYGIPNYVAPITVKLPPGPSRTMNKRRGGMRLFFAQALSEPALSFFVLYHGWWRV